MKAEADAKLKEEERLKAEAGAKRQKEEEARLKAEADAKRQKEEERLKDEADAKRQKGEEARLKAEADAKLKEEERLKAEADAKLKEEERLKAEADAKRQKEEEERLKADSRRRKEERLKVEAARRQKQLQQLLLKQQKEKSIYHNERKRVVIEGKISQRDQQRTVRPFVSPKSTRMNLTEQSNQALHTYKHTVNASSSGSKSDKELRGAATKTKDQQQHLHSQKLSLSHKQRRSQQYRPRSQNPLHQNHRPNPNSPRPSPSQPPLKHTPSDSIVSPSACDTESTKASDTTRSHTSAIDQLFASFARGDHSTQNQRQSSAVTTVSQSSAAATPSQPVTDAIVGKNTLLHSGTRDEQISHRRPAGEAVVDSMFGLSYYAEPKTPHNHRLNPPRTRPRSSCTPHNRTPSTQLQENSSFVSTGARATPFDKAAKPITPHTSIIDKLLQGIDRGVSVRTELASATSNKEETSSPESCSATGEVTPVKDPVSPTPLESPLGPRDTQQDVSKHARKAKPKDVAADILKRLQTKRK